MLTKSHSALGHTVRDVDHYKWVVKKSATQQLWSCVTPCLDGFQYGRAGTVGDVYVKGTLSPEMCAR
jgi:hypothetical protein